MWRVLKYRPLGTISAIFLRRVDMTTLMTHGLFLTRNVGAVFMLIVVLMVVANFLLVLHTEHSAVRQQLRDDAWLLKRCGEPDFYLKLKQHTDLCESVERNARRNVLLHCVTHALRSTHFCGFDSCANIAAAVVQTLLYGGMWSITAFICMLLIVPILLRYAYQMFVNTVAENHLRTKYNFPYGINAALLHAEHEAAHLRRRPAPRYEALNDIPQECSLLLHGGV